MAGLSQKLMQSLEKTTSILEIRNWIYDNADKLHKELWLWLVDNPTARKSNWPGFADIEGHTLATAQALAIAQGAYPYIDFSKFSYCFACFYAFYDASAAEDPYSLHHKCRDCTALSQSPCPLRQTAEGKPQWHNHDVACGCNGFGSDYFVWAHSTSLGFDNRSALALKIANMHWTPKPEPVTAPWPQ